MAKSEMPDKPLVWETQNTPQSFTKGQKTWDAICFVGMGAINEKPVSFTLFIGGKPVADITATLKDAEWIGESGVQINYQVKESVT